MERWKDEFVSVSSKLRYIRQKPSLVQTDLSAFPLSEEFQKEELELLNWLGLWLWLANEEDQAKQKSREGWLQLGDRNSHFFYAATKARLQGTVSGT